MTTRAIKWVVDMGGNLEKGAAGAGKAVGALGIATGAATAAVGAMTAAAAAAAAGYVKLVNEVVTYVDTINTAANATGLLNESVKGLDILAESTGKSLESILPKRLASNMLLAAEGSKEMERAFRRLKVDVGEVGALTDANDAFLQLIDTFDAMPPSADRAALAARVLGRSAGPELLSAIDGGADSLKAFIALGREFGTDVGPEAVEAIGEWQKATAVLGVAFDTLKDSALKAIGGPEGAATLMTEFAVVVVGAAEGIVVWFDELNTRATALGRTMDLLAQGKFGEAFRNQADALIDAAGFLERAEERISERTERFRELVGNLGSGGSTSGGSRRSEEQAATVKAKIVDPGDLGRLLDLGAIAEIIAETLDGIDAGITNLETLPAVMAGLPTARDMVDAMGEGALRGAEAALQSADSLLRGIDFFGLGGTAATALSIARDIDGTIEGLAGDILAIPDDIGSSIERLLTTVIPEFVAALPQFAIALAIEMPQAIIRGIVGAIPALVEAIVPNIRAIGQQLVGGLDAAMGFLFGDFWDNAKNWFGSRWSEFRGNLDNILYGPFVRGITDWFRDAWNTVKEFFANLFSLGKDGGLLTGKEGKVLGTSLKKGDRSLLGIRFGGRKNTGGNITHDGMFQLEKGEKVIPAHENRGGSPVNLTVVVNGATDPQETARQVVRAAQRMLGDLALGESLTPAS